MSCPSTGESTDKMRWIHTAENESAQKRKGVLTHTTPWMNPEDTKVGELSHPQRANAVLLNRHEVPPGNQIHRDRKEKGACQGVGGGRLGSDCLLGTEVQFEKMKKLWR